MSVVKDLIEAHTARESAAGFGSERVFFVDEVQGKPEARLYNALLSPDIPKMGELHPVIPLVQVTDRQASPVNGDSSQVQIRITYGIPTAEDAALDPDNDTSPGTASLSTSLVSEQEVTDINGDLLTARYSGFSGEIGFFTTTKYATIDVQRPQNRISFKRKESRAPKTAIDTYLGKINSHKWSGYAVRTWLCSGISATQVDGGFDVEYSFVYREETWRVEIVYGMTPEDAANVPIDVQSGNGFASYEVYNVADFNKLGLSF